MKKIKGISFEELTSKVIECAEVELASGGRYWISSDEYTSKAAYDAEVKRISDAGELSDMDIVVTEKQPVEIRECLNEVERLRIEFMRSNDRNVLWDEIFEVYGTDEAEDDTGGEDVVRAEFKLSSENMLAMVKAGKATITLQSGDTGKHFTYRIEKHSQKALWFVSLMTGTNNDDDFSYMAHFWNDNKLHMTAKSCVKTDSKPALAFKYFMDHVNKIPEKLGVYHSGKCCRCGRTLTTPESIERGLGPECSKLVV